MWKGKYKGVKGTSRFFYIALSHDSLVGHYKTNFALMHQHNFQLEDLDNMLPWEREIYVTLLTSWIEERNREDSKYG
jgi:hypothetical protein